MCFSGVPARLARFMAGIGLSVACVGHPNFAHAGTLVEANTAFALDLYAQLKETPGQRLLLPLQHFKLPGHGLRRRSWRERKANGKCSAFRQRTKSCPCGLRRITARIERGSKDRSYRTQRRQCVMDA